MEKEQNESQIGGYIEMELASGNEYHNDALRFNSGRNALSYFLLKNKISDLFVPTYICDSITDTLTKGKTKFHFYEIDEELNPLITPEEVGNKYILLVNYFGICEKMVKENIKNFKNKIVDNSHAFFSNPEPDVPTFYSPRKFLGVADGGYLYAKGLENDHVTYDDSAQRYMARLVRIESGAKAGYYIYRNTEQLISRAKIRKMSVLTQQVLESIRYDMVWEKREFNFKYLHTKLKNINNLKINEDSVHGPMIYPFLADDNELINYLNANNIFVQQLWPEVIKRVDRSSFEYEMSTKLCALPIDQRYSKDEMDIIIHFVKEYYKNNEPSKDNASLEEIEVYR